MYLLLGGSCVLKVLNIKFTIGIIMALVILAFSLL